jgi:energy-coupling factor transporter ATP-binding protein EcfA2
MITKVTVENFRSIERTELELASLVLLYGPTASGKSSLLYAPIVLKNFILNPNRPADGFFHLGFMDLGGFDESVFNHEKSREVCIAVHHDAGGTPASYKVCLSKNKARLVQQWGSLRLEGEVAVPYGLNQTFPFSYSENGDEFTINWNGISCSVSPKSPTADTQRAAQQIATSLNSSAETIKSIDIAPHRRGFFKPNYTTTPVSPTPTTEDEVASLIISDPNLAPRISVYAEEIFGRDFRLYTPPGTATVFFQTTDKKSRMPALLVNDGFGVNQVVYLLAKILRSDVKTILIEEPEVHLHPTALRNFARQVCTIAREEKKQIILTTHNELFVSAILAAVAEGKLSPEEIRCYLVQKDKRATTLRLQRVQPNGQIEGGLTTFIEAELEDLKTLLGLKG